jgi:hypothetical protein
MTEIIPEYAITRNVTKSPVRSTADNQDWPRVKPEAKMSEYRPSVTRFTDMNE